MPETQTVTQSSTTTFNFSRAGAISNDQMRTIATIHDLYARNLVDTLGAWLRAQLQVDAHPGQQKTWAEAAATMPELAYICSMRIEPMGALGIIEFDLALASPIIDALLGGVGRSEPMREVTDIEEAILLSVIQILLRELNTVWQPVGLHFVLEKREHSSQMARLLPPAEKTLCVGFDMQLPEAKGTVKLTLPAVALSTTLRQLSSERDRPRRRTPEIRERLGTLLEDASVSTVLQFAPMRLDAKALMTLTPGAVLRLPLPVHAAAQLCCNGIPMAQARPVQVEEHRGAQLLPGIFGNTAAQSPAETERTA